MIIWLKLVLIDAPPSHKNKSHYYHHYMSRWSKFIPQIMAVRLSKTEIRDVLPEIRNSLPTDTDLSDIYPLRLPTIRRWLDPFLTARRFLIMHP